MAKVEATAPRGDRRLDLTGLRCPLPVLRIEAALRSAAAGQTFVVRTDDPLAAVDVPHAVASAGHRCVRLPQEGKVCVFEVTSKG